MKYKLVIPEDGLTKDELIRMAENINLNWFVKKNGKYIDLGQISPENYPGRCIIREEPKTHDEILDSELSMFAHHEDCIFGLTRNTLRKLMQLAVENEKLKD